MLEISSQTRIGNSDEAKTRILDLRLKQLCHYYLDAVCNFIAAVILAHK
jgi:hypothetical protein